MSWSSRRPFGRSIYRCRACGSNLPGWYLSGSKVERYEGKMEEINGYWPNGVQSERYLSRKEELEQKMK